MMRKRRCSYLGGKVGRSRRRNALGVRVRDSLETSAYREGYEGGTVLVGGVWSLLLTSSLCTEWEMRRKLSE